VPQTNPYAYATFAEVKQALFQRLNSTGADFWTDAECGIYIEEALRVWNCLTQTWLEDWTKPFTSADVTWQSTGSTSNALVGSNSTPRSQTLTDSYVYTVAQYHLLEPPTGGAAWTGTPQFTLADFIAAFQRRRDTILQITGCNIGPFSTSFSLAPGDYRVQLPDSTVQSILDLRRVRLVPASGMGAPSTLYREDGMAFEYFHNSFLQINENPLSWDVLAGPPLMLTFDALVNVANTLDILAILSGGNITAGTAAPLLIPDDWYWVLKFGMMADLLRKESESNDLERSDYCEKRFQEGLQLMKEMPWLTQARINNVPCDTPSVAEMDTFAYEWQSDPDAPPVIVRGGVDLFAISPTVTDDVAITLTLVANTPIPATDADFVQVSRDVLNAILDEAEHLAKFKEGGFEFAESTRTLHKSFISTAIATNSRLRESGIFATDLRPVGDSRQEAAMPRFAGASQ
jgi:hypothetical protein